MRFAAFICAATLLLVSIAQAGTWTQVITDDFHRSASSTVGNGWNDPFGEGSIVGNTLTLTVPAGGTGTDIRVVRPVSEASLNQRIEASFVMPATNDGLSHSVFVRGKSIVIGGYEVYPVMIVSARHSGAVSTQLNYRGGAGVFVTVTGTSSFTPTAGHAYTLAVQVTNNFPTVLAATLRDDTTSTQVASISYNDLGLYAGPKTHLSPDFKIAGVMGVAMEGAAGKSVSFTQVTTYSWSETGSLSAAFVPAVTQYGGKTYLASPFPSGGVGPYNIRWYRGANNFTPPVKLDGSGTGTGTYIGNAFEQVDASPPTGISNFSISYRAVYFDSGSNATTGVLGSLTNQNSPTVKNYAVPLWIGDSITAGYATSTANYTQSPGTYSQTYLNADTTFAAAYTMPIAGSANNLGFSGRTSGDLVTLLPRVIGQARLVGATFANIMLGSNDSKNSVATSSAQYKSNIQTIITALKAQRADMKIVLNKSIWYKPDTGYNSDFSTASLARITQYHAMLDQLADGTNILIGGMTAYNEIQTNGWTGTTGVSNVANATTAYPPAPTGGKSYLVDGLHPYDGGAEMIAKLEWGPNAKNAVFGNVTPIPVVNAGADQVITVPVLAVTLTGAAASNNSSIADYAWTKLSGGAATIVSPFASTTQVTGMTQGTYVFRLTATDAKGASGNDDVQVTVHAPSFALWVEENGLSGSEALPPADPDGNGIANLSEYALGMAHGSSDQAGLPTLAFVDGLLTLTYPQVRTDVIYQPEWTSDFITWNTDVITIATVGDFTTASIPMAANTRLFLRLKIVLQ